MLVEDEKASIALSRSKEREESKSASRRLTSPMVIGGEERMGAREWHCVSNII